MEELHRRVGPLFILPAEGPQRSPPNTLTISVWISALWPLGFTGTVSQPPLAPNAPFEPWAERLFHVRSRWATPLIGVTSHSRPIRAWQKGPASGPNDDVMEARGRGGDQRDGPATPEGLLLPAEHQLTSALDLDIDLPLSTRAGAKEHQSVRGRLSVRLC